MPPVEKDQNSRAREHYQNPSFFFISLRVITQRKLGIRKLLFGKLKC